MNKIKVIFALVMVLSLMASLFMIPAFADENDEVMAISEDTPAEEAADSAAEDAEGADTVVADTEDVDVDIEAEVADGAEDVEADGAEDVAENAEAEAEDTAEETKAAISNSWTDLGTSEYIAIAVAAVILVGAVVAIILLAPGKPKHK